jgi:hypothetical protein
MDQKVLVNPGYEMILESALDELMEDVGSNELRHMSTRRVFCKELWNHLSMMKLRDKAKPHM